MTAKIKLNAASGGGSVSLQAPTSTTNDANLEFKLPVADGTSGQALTTNASGQLAFASTSGLAMADQWRLTTSTGSITANSDTYITDNWSRVNTDGFGQLGNGMTQSTGI